MNSIAHMPRKSPPKKKPPRVVTLEGMLEHKRPKSRDTSLASFLPDWFKKEVEKPAAKLGVAAEVWTAIAPPALRDSCSLIGFSKGTLTIAAPSALHRNQLDMNLRAGLLRQLQDASKGAVYKIKTLIQAEAI
jgi:hypothetical protein